MMTKLCLRKCQTRAAVLLAILICASLVHSSEKTAKQILAELEPFPGFAVVLDCGNEELVGLLVEAKEDFLFHGLGASDAAVEKARTVFRTSGFYPARITVENRIRGGRLPYPDYCANLILQSEPVKAAAGDMAWKEIIRVLMPERGHAWIRMAKRDDKLVGALSELGATGIQWSAENWLHFRRSRPEGMGSWSHDRRVNARLDRIGDDDLVRGPFHTAWLNMIPSSFTKFGIPIAAEGYLVLRHGGILAGKQKLYKHPIQVFDGYNGFFRWKTVLPEDGGFGLVAAGGSLYAVAGKTLYSFSLKTGQSKWSVKQQELGEKMVWANYLATPEHLIAGLGILSPKQKPGTLPAIRKIVRIDPNSGQIGWQHDTPQPSSFVATEKGCLVYCAPGKSIGAISIKTGKELWSNPIKHRGSRNGMSIRSGQIYFGNTYDLLTGKLLTKGEKKSGALYHVERKKTPIGNRLEISTAQPGKLIGSVTQYVDPYDPKTGIPKGSWCYGRCIIKTRSRHCLFYSGCGTLILDYANARIYSAESYRSNCRTGIIVANGLAYNSPSGCNCNFTIRGGVALLPVPLALYEGLPESNPPPQLEKGPAFADSINEKSSPNDWPAYRHDGKRSCATTATVEVPLQNSWSVKPGGALTAPIAAGGRVYVGSSNHSVYALARGDGSTIWTFTTGGRIAVAPTYWNGRLFVGSEDGWVYALRADNGKLIWRFRGAPHDRKTINRKRIQSVWPVGGGIITDPDGKLIFYAGMSSADKMHLYKLDGKTGSILWRNDSAGSATNETNVATGASPYGVSPVGILCASDDMIYVPQGESVPAGFRRSDGKLLWWKRRGDSEQRSNIHMQWNGGPDLSYGDGWLFIGGGTASPKAPYFYAVNGKNGRALGQDLKRLFSHKSIGRKPDGWSINPKTSLWGIRAANFGSNSSIPPIVFDDRVVTFSGRRASRTGHAGFQPARVHYREEFRKWLDCYLKGEKDDSPQPLAASFGGDAVGLAGEHLVSISGKGVAVKSLKDGKAVWTSKSPGTGAPRVNAIAITDKSIVTVTGKGEVLCWTR